MKNVAAADFNIPVDAIGWGIPHYLDIIKVLED